MSLDLFLALAGFAFVTSITPGPNNLMLMASGANFGLRRTVPHMLGVSIGFAVMAFVLGAGLAQMFDRWPLLHDVLKGVSVVYMLWLAWRIAHAAPPRTGEAGGRPLSFLEAVLFQWVNPKAWAMALTAVTVYAPAQTLSAMAGVAGIFALINLPSVGCWAIFGLQVRRLLTRPARLRQFNIAMALLLVASLYPVLML